MAQEEGDSVSVELDIDEGRTILSLTGDRSAAVVVRSDSGERIYLPPEEEEEEEEEEEGDSSYRPAGADSSYQPVGAEDSPYEGIDDQSPYDASRQSAPSVGLQPRPDGFRIVHPEPVTDVRLLR